MKTFFTSLLFGCFAICITSTSFAQLTSPILHVGIGLGNQLTLTGAESGIPPLSASLDYPVTDEITAGGFIGYTGFNVPLGFGDAKYKYSYVIIGARGTYHFDFGPEKLDPYAGAMLSYNVVNAKVVDGNGFPNIAAGAASGVAFSALIGANYALTEKVGAFAELGYGIAWLTIGASINL